MPDSMRICGVPIAPADKMTSFFAATVDRLALDYGGECLYKEYGSERQVPFSLGANSTFMKVGFPPVREVSTSLVTVFSMRTWRFLRLNAGWRYATAELLRWPPPTVDGVGARGPKNEQQAMGRLEELLFTYTNSVS